MPIRRANTPEATAQAALKFLKSLPDVHDRPGQPAHSGGLNLRLGRVMVEELQKVGTPSIVETGAGNSSLLVHDARMQHGHVDRARREARTSHLRGSRSTRSIDTNSFTFINDRSERALPKLAVDEKQKCEAAFIDGNHGWPSVFVDFCYLNMMMGTGAILFVDDVHVYACAQLQLLLMAQPEYEFLRLDGKMATFRKTSDAQFLPDWRYEPFILMNTPGVILG